MMTPPEPVMSAAERSLELGDREAADLNRKCGKRGDRLTGRTPLHKPLRIDPRRLMSKLLHVLNV
jgi:hypothetical protein